MSQKFDDQAVLGDQFDVRAVLTPSTTDHPVGVSTVQYRQHEKLFRPLNELHYGMSVRTRDDMKGDLQEHTKLMGRIVNPPETDIDAQTDYQKRLLQVVVHSPTMKARDSNSRANPGFAAYVVDVVLPEIRDEFGTTTRANVMLVVAYAKQKDLYHRHFAKLRAQGWADTEMPELFTVDASLGYDAHLAILDIVNDDWEGFLRDKSRCCVAFSRAKQQMIFISGRLAEVRVDDTRQVVRDATDDGKIKTIHLKRPLLHWASYFVTKKCQWDFAPPEFEIPADLAFYGEGQE
jgi:hypothetical protein